MSAEASVLQILVQVTQGVLHELDQFLHYDGLLPPSDEDSLKFRIPRLMGAIFMFRSMQKFTPAARWDDWYGTRDLISTMLLTLDLLHLYLQEGVEQTSSVQDFQYKRDAIARLLQSLLLSLNENGITLEP